MVSVNATGGTSSKEQDEEAAASLQQSVQAILDDYRNQDVAAATARYTLVIPTAKLTMFVTLGALTTMAP